jgi:hypothetical protein
LAEILDEHNQKAIEMFLDTADPGGYRNSVLRQRPVSKSSLRGQRPVFNNMVCPQGGCYPWG